MGAFAIYTYLKFFYVYLIEEEMSMAWLYFKYFNRVLVPMMILGNLYYAVLYYFRFPFIEQFKVNNVRWPWEEDPKGWPRRLANCMKVYAVNQLVIFPIVFILVTLLFKCDVSLSNLPSYFTFVWQLITCTILEDFFFYFSHRALHTPFLYTRIHKKHHEYSNAISYASVYTHWVEFVICNALPLLSSLILMQNHMHIVTYAGYAFYRVMGTYSGHSGYEFPWCPHRFFAFNVEPGFHNFHHLKNMGNYGSTLWIWDYYFRTSEHFYREAGILKDK
jgi:sterol desaturase/sphingolipid hydroxylase (fatty acid hydroxylase superfamily)